MSRWLPHPLLAVFLWVTWLTLQQSLSPGTMALGLVLALVLSYLLERLQVPVVRMGHVGTLIVLCMRVLADMTRSNIAVARIILLRPEHSSGFVTIPLEITSPYALAALACIITATPGTTWVSHDSRRRQLTIHVLDLVDEATWIETVKRRYERPLLKIIQ